MKKKLKNPTIRQDRCVQALSKFVTHPPARRIILFSLIPDI